MNNVKPYVYRCEHKITGEFYFGSRSANIVPAKDDLGIHYFTSSTIVSSDFVNYKYEILSEYCTAKEALMVEQYLIWKSFNDPKILNRACKSGGYASEFGERYPTKRERRDNYPANKIKCPIRPGVLIDPADLLDVSYIRDRIATTSSKKNLKKWCQLLLKLL